jgi:phosphoribosylaminoimidazolecarboxamide formyltransferase/IMP cyclohydrolase
VAGFNKTVDLATAQEILAGIDKYGFMECLLAPAYDADALEALQAKKNLRLLELADLKTAEPWMIKQVSGGLLVQSPDNESIPSEMKVVTKRAPSPEETAALRFAWIVCKHTKSNAIVIARDTKAVGIGGGVFSRVDATHLAVEKAGDRAKGAVLASDAFFPKADAVEAAAAAGVTAMIQPGGSIKDEETIAACDAHGITMVFTGARHFRH